MSDRIIYISRVCPHCKKLLIGIHKYAFLKNQFKIVDVTTQQYPDYIETVPTLVANQQMIKNEDVFGYMNNLVEQIFKNNPDIKNRYHPAQQQAQQPQQQAPQPQQPQQQHQQSPQPSFESMKDIGNKVDELDELVGWCPDGGCSFAPITESNDDVSKSTVSLEDTRFSFITEENHVPNDGIEKIAMENSNDAFQKNEKHKMMESSYERMMAERQLIK